MGNGLYHGSRGSDGASRSGVFRCRRGRRAYAADRWHDRPGPRPAAMPGGGPHRALRSRRPECGAVRRGGRPPVPAEAVRRQGASLRDATRRAPSRDSPDRAPRRGRSRNRETPLRSSRLPRGCVRVARGSSVSTEDSSPPGPGPGPERQVVAARQLPVLSRGAASRAQSRRWACSEPSCCRPSSLGPRSLGP